MLRETGSREIVLTGIHLGHYGQDLRPPTDLATLLRGCFDASSRLRLSSVEPMEVDPVLMNFFCLFPSLCPHLHVPIQSGDDTLLAAMNRPYRSSQIWDLFHALRRRSVDLALGTDLIAGFPGETEEQFGRTLDFVVRSPLTHLHVFPFSPRPGTPAASFSGRVAAEISRARARALREAGVRKTALFAASQVGKRRPVIIVSSQEKKGLLLGVSDNYLEVAVEGPRSWIGRLIEVELKEVFGIRLHGRAIAPD
jgi:threonylcarbamoyladenosine tRNA methylthiotransferase MtaB